MYLANSSMLSLSSPAIWPLILVLKAAQVL
jgi:hypothetical protein